MKRKEDSIRENFGTLVTFLVLALLLFHSPYSKAQGLVSRQAAIKEAAAVLADGEVLNSQNNRIRYAAIRKLIDATVPPGFPVVKAPLLSEGVALIRELLVLQNPRVTADLTLEMAPLANQGVRFGDSIVYVVLENLEFWDQDWAAVREMPKFPYAALRFLIANEGVTPGLTDRIAPFKAKHPQCYVATVGAS